MLLLYWSCSVVVIFVAVDDDDDDTAAVKVDTTDFVTTFSFSLSFPLLVSARGRGHSGALPVFFLHYPLPHLLHLVFFSFFLPRDLQKKGRHI